MKKSFALPVAVALSITLVLTNLMICDTARAAAKETKKLIAVLVQHTTQKRWNNADLPSIRARAAELGYDVFVQSAEDDSEKQIKQAEIAVLKGASCIIINPVNFKAGNGIVEMAAEEGIPVIAYNDIIEDSAIAGFVGRNSKELGTISAKKMVEHYPNGNYIICGGDEMQSVSREMVAGYKEVLAAHPGIAIVSSQFNKDWATERALKQVEGALLANKNNIQAILCCNDSLALGSIQALEASGIVGGVGVSGQDAETSALQNIHNGTMTFTVFTEFKQMGIDAVNMAHALITKGELPPHSVIANGSGKDIPWIKTQMIIVDRSNLQEFVDSHSWWVAKRVFGN